MAQEPTVNTRRIYKGRVVGLRVDQVELPDGRLREREIVEARGAVGIVALDPQGLLLLERQFRKPAEQVLWEIPAGTLEPHETPLQCARRELAEETGYHADLLTPLAAFYTSPGFCDEMMHLFLAEGLSRGEQHLESDEFLSVRSVPVAQALDMISSGEIADAKTIVGILLLVRKREEEPAE